MFPNVGYFVHSIWLYLILGDFCLYFVFILFVLYFNFLFCVGGSSRRWSNLIVVDFIILVNDGGDVANGVFAKEKIVIYVVVGLEMP